MLKHLPEIVPQRLAIKVKTAAEKMIRKEHPWVFGDSIVKQSKEGKAGDLAIIFDQKKNKFLALGLYDPDSPIRIKLLQFKQSKNLDETWFQDRIQAAYDLRKPLLATDTNSYRFINGENDGLGALIVDVYADVLVMKLYSAIWLPYLNIILPILIKISQCKTVVLRLSRLLQQDKTSMHALKDGQILYGTLKNENIIFKEHALLFSANVIKGHKTGYFLDHRNNRKRVGELSKGKTVLDIFSYAGGFTVHALGGGAKAVTSLDISAQALAMGKQNVALNFKKAKHHTMAIDAFEGMQNMAKARKQFDIVIVDPPSFAKRASERDKALHSYARLAKLAIQLVAKKGILILASCSSRVNADDFFEVSLKALDSNPRKYTIVEKTFHDIDHPISFPEGAYLKCIYLQY